MPATGEKKTAVEVVDVVPELHLAPERSHLAMPQVIDEGGGEHRPDLVAAPDQPSSQILVLVSPAHEALVEPVDFLESGEDWVAPMKWIAWQNATARRRLPSI